VHSARIGGQQKLALLPDTLWAEALIRSATWNGTARALSIDALVQINASIRYAISRQTEVYLRGENLTNNRAPQIFNTDCRVLRFTAVFNWGF
jgi:vitamin B12 transporter